MTPKRDEFEENCNVLSLRTRVELLEMEVAALRSVLSEWDEDKSCYGQFMKANAIREIFNYVADYTTDE